MIFRGLEKMIPLNELYQSSFSLVMEHKLQCCYSTINTDASINEMPQNILGLSNKCQEDNYIACRKNLTLQSFTKT